MCKGISSGDKEGASENVNKEFRYYSITAHQIVLVIWLIIISMLLIFIFSLFIGGIERLYQEWDGMWTCEDNRESGTSGVGFNLGVLPDFLGGMVGILVGFFLEWLIFEKIKNLSKYRTIISCLKIEFDKIEMLLTYQRKKINEVITDDIVLSAENSVIIENLPHFFVFRRSRQGEKLLSLLQEIHGEITFRNDALIRQGIMLCENEVNTDNVISAYDKKTKELLDKGYTQEKAKETLYEKYFLVKHDDKVYKVGEPYILDENGCVTDETMRDSILGKIKTFKRATMKSI